MTSDTGLDASHRPSSSLKMPQLVIRSAVTDDILVCLPCLLQRTSPKRNTFLLRAAQSNPALLDLGSPNRRKAERGADSVLNHHYDAIISDQRYQNFNRNRVMLLAVVLWSTTRSWRRLMHLPPSISALAEHLQYDVARSPGLSIKPRFFVLVHSTSLATHITKRTVTASLGAAAKRPRLIDLYVLFAEYGHRLMTNRTHFAHFRSEGLVIASQAVD